MSPPRQRTIRRLEVVIPARNEDATLVDCLESVALSAAAVDCPVRATVVLDRCTDASAGRVEEVATGALATGVGVVVRGMEVAAGSVGAARRAGLEAVPDGADPSAVWVLCTDADSVVPPDWLPTMYALAADGCDLVTGLVEPLGIAPGVRQRWADRQQLGPGHPHVHGANLGFRLSAYRAVGGFAPLSVGEDHDMVDRLLAAGFRHHATDRARVLTSGRAAGRVDGGFATYLRVLD